MFVCDFPTLTSVICLPYPHSDGFSLGVQLPPSMDQPGLYIQALFPLVSHLCCFISLLRVSFIGLFHVVQEIRLRSDYREIILLKKKRSRGRTADPLQLLLSCWGGPSWTWGSLEDPRWGLWCLIVAAWTCLCFAPPSSGLSGGRGGKGAPFLEEGDPLFLHVSDQRGLLSSRAENVFNIVRLSIVQHSADSHLCLDFPSC